MVHKVVHITERVKVMAVMHKTPSFSTVIVHSQETTVCSSRLTGNTVIPLVICQYHCTIMHFNAVI